MRFYSDHDSAESALRMALWIESAECNMPGIIGYEIRRKPDGSGFRLLLIEESDERELR